MLFNLYTCREALQRLDDYIDRELPPQETERVRRHLRLCHACAKKFAFEMDIVEGVRAKLRRIEAPSDLLAKISAVLRQAESSAGE